MTDLHPYTYVILRYRHDALAGEFANVGVVLHERGSGFLAAKVRHTIGRLSKMFPDIDANALRSSLRNIEAGFQRLAEARRPDLLGSLGDAGSHARRVLVDDDSSFIWSDVGSGVTSDASLELDKLYGRFVRRYEEPLPQHRDDLAVWKPVRDRLTAMNLAGRLQTKTIVSPLDRLEFTHAWKNGVWHCYQPLSFDLASEDSIATRLAGG
jgi:hypothetical protein